MEFSPMFPFVAPAHLKVAVDHLASLDEKELTAINEVFTNLDAPINRRKIKATGERVREKISRLSDDESENLVGLALQLISVPDFMDVLDGLEAINDKNRTNVKRALETFKSNEALKKAIAIDRVLDRGPRLQSLSCFCDVRTHFSSSDGTRATDVPREEFRVPMAIVRMKIDEIPQYIYFQLSASELDEHISTLQKASSQLRYVAERARI